MDLLDLELAGVILVAVFGGIHLESLSHLLLFLAAGLADLGEDGLGDFGVLIHLVVSGDLDGPDGHCHELAGGVVVGPVGLGAGAGAVVVIFLLGFMTTLLGHDKFGGLLDLYFGVVVGPAVLGDVGVIFDLAGGSDLLSKVTVGPGPSYGSSDAGGILNNLIMS